MTDGTGRFFGRCRIFQMPVGERVSIELQRHLGFPQSMQHQKQQHNNIGLKGHSVSRCDARPAQ
jgi:hypothetical protein